MKTSKGLLLVAALAACLNAAQLVTGEPYTTRQGSLPCHRLPINVSPKNYDLRLRFPSLDSDVYEGQVDISFIILKVTDSLIAGWNLEHVPCVKDFGTDTIVLHADKTLEIQDIKVFIGHQEVVESVSGCMPLCEKKTRQFNEVVEIVEVEELIRDEAKQMVAIKLKRSIEESPNCNLGRVSITFKGRMRNDERGVYLGTFNDGERDFKQIVMQLKETDARTVFPSFDEPSFVAHFSVSVTHPKGLNAYGNTKVESAEDMGDLTLTRFATTPLMRPHHLAFTIGEFVRPVIRQKKRDRLITSLGKLNKKAIGKVEKSSDWLLNFIHVLTHY